MFVTNQLMDPIDFNSMEINTMDVNVVLQLIGFRHSSKYLVLCSAKERNSFRFGREGE